MGYTNEVKKTHTPAGLSTCHDCKTQCCRDCMEPKSKRCNDCYTCQYSPNGVRCTWQRAIGASVVQCDSVRDHARCEKMCISCSECHYFENDMKSVKCWVLSRGRAGYVDKLKYFCHECIKKQPQRRLITT